VIWIALWLGAAQASSELEDARALVASGQATAALDALAPLLSSENPDAIALAAQARLSLGEVTRARQSLEAAIARAPTPQTHRDLARCYRALGDEEAALAQATLAVAGSAEGAEALLAGALAATRSADAADEILSGVLPVEARAPVRDALAMAYTDEERHRDAAAAWGAALTHDPLSPEAPRWQASIAESHRRGGRMSAEIAALGVLVDGVGPGSAWSDANPAGRDAAEALTAERLRSALDHYTLDVQMMPGSATATAALGDLSRLYTLWLGRYPDDIQARKRQLAYGALLTRQGRFSEALAQYEDAYRADEDADEASEALLSIAHLAYRLQLQAPEEQQRWLRRLLWAADEHARRFAAEKADAEIQWRAAEGLLLAERTDDALERLEAVVARWPATGAAERSARRVLDIYILQRDWDAARDAAERFAAQPALGDAAFQARLAEVTDQTRRRP
jgi:tetratricopeptide (TPR) repeat protein